MFGIKSVSSWTRKVKIKKNLKGGVLEMLSMPQFRYPLSQRFHLSRTTAFHLLLASSVIVELLKSSRRRQRSSEEVCFDWEIQQMKVILTWKHL